MKADSTVFIDTAFNTDGAEAGAKRLQGAYKRMASTLTNMCEVSKNSAKESVSAYSELNRLIEQQEQKVNSLKEQLQKLSEQKIETEEFRKLNEQIGRLEKGIRDAEAMKEALLARGFDEGSSNIRGYLEKIDRWSKKLEELKTKQASMKADGKAYLPVDTSGLEDRLLEEEKKLISMQERAGASFEETSRKVLSYGQSISRMAAQNRDALGVFSSFRSALSKMAGIMGRLAKLAGGSLLSGLKRAAKSILSLQRNTDRTNSTMGTGMKSFLKYTIGLAGLSALFGKIKSATQEGFSNLSVYSRTTNESISSLA